MKLVTFIRDMLPVRAGETRVLSEEVAARMAALGYIDSAPPDWPLKDPPAEKPPPLGRPSGRPPQSPDCDPGTGNGRRQTYITK